MKVLEEEIPMSTLRSLIVEIHAAEGGQDSRSLVEEQLAIYVKRAVRSGL